MHTEGKRWAEVLGSHISWSLREKRGMNYMN